jgi:hypothetical protein
MKRPGLPLVEIEWLDAITHTEMWALSEIEQKATLTRRLTSGYLFKQTDDGRTIVAHTFDPKEGTDTEDCLADLTVIPTGWVQTIKYIRGKRPHNKRRK